jgi:hypothetical protein
VGGAEVAGGDAAELVRRGPRAGPDGARGLAGDVAEGAAEGAQAAPAGPKGDLGDREVGVAEERGRPLDAAGEQVAVRGEAERLLEGAGEVGGGDAAHARQAGDGPGLVGGGVHAVPGAQEAPEEIGVLGGRAHW